MTKHPNEKKEAVTSKHGFITTASRSALMKKIKSKETIPETMVRRSLWTLGYRYRKNYDKLPGKPDIAFVRQRIVVFVDGEFWHGHKWEERKHRIAQNRECWIRKIERNIQRDTEANKQLSQLGWVVIRFWAGEVRDDLEKCTLKVTSYLKEQESGGEVPMNLIRPLVHRRLGSRPNTERL